MSYREVQTYAKSCGVAASGSKAAIIARYEKFLADMGAQEEEEEMEEEAEEDGEVEEDGEESDDEDEDEDEDEEVDWAQLKLPELVDAVAERVNELEDGTGAVVRKQKWKLRKADWVQLLSDGFGAAAGMSAEDAKAAVDGVAKGGIAWA